MQKTLILKLGALGDVLRTTTLLHIIKGEILWLTKENAIPLLQNIKKINPIPWSKKDLLLKEEFDLVISLDDEKEACSFASKLKTKKLIGACLKDGKLAYTDEAKGWFDMGLISEYGKEKADLLKMQNKKTVQEHLYAMLDKKFHGQKYCFSLTEQEKNKAKKILNKIPKEKPLIGINTGAGGRWKTKSWDEGSTIALIKNLLENYYVLLLGGKEEKTRNKKIKESVPDVIDAGSNHDLRTFAAFVGECDAVITADSLLLHLAIAANKKTIAIFNCTSPDEIYDYGIVRKLVNPYLNEWFYNTKENDKIRKAITPKIVEEALIE